MAKNIPFYNLTLPPATRRAVEKTLRTGWITTGPVATEFEKALSGLLGVRHVAAVASATAGLVLALKAAGVKRGSEVITSPFSFVAGVEVILNLGATAVFADIDPDTLNMDWRAVTTKITKKTSAILTVDIAGYPCDYRKLGAIAKSKGIFLISDAAHALGSTLNGKSIPRWTDIAVYSFHATKNLTCGEGGAVATKSESLDKHVRLWAKHSMTANAYERKRSGSWNYDIAELGFKANMSDVLASIGLAELSSFHARQLKREKLALRYLSNLSTESDLLSLPALERGFHHAWHLFIARLNLDRLKIGRSEVIAKLAQAGIGASVHYRPIHALSFYKHQKLPSVRLPNAEKAGRSVISLPLFPDLRASDVDRVSDTLLSILRRHSR